jgi:putative PIN family toxin of toxin-antitoxin system
MSGSDGILAVVDTNLVVSSIISNRGAPYQLIHSLYDGKFRLVITDAIRDEYVDVLSRPFLTNFGDIAANDIAAFLRFIDRHAVSVVPLDVQQLPLLVRDSKDDDLLAAALGGQADHLVSGDNDLLDLADDPRLGRLQIVNPRQFLGIIEQA